MPARERRYILRSLFSPGSVKFWSLKTDAARLIYLAMIVHADDEGRVECGWRQVAAMAPRWKIKQNAIIGAVKDLEGVGLIRKYGVDKYGAFLGWSERSILPTEDPNSLASRYGFAPSFAPHVATNSLPTRSEVATESLPCRSIVAGDKTPVFKWCCIINGFTQSQSGKEVKWESDPIPAPPDGFQLHEKSPLLSKLSKEDRKIESLFGDAGRTFADAKRRFRRIVGRNFGSLGQREREWSGFVASVGAEMALAALELWAKENKDWLKEECKNPLTNFLKNKSDMVEAVEIERERAASAPSGEPNEELSDEEFNRREHERLFGAKESDHPLKKGTVQ